MPGPTLETDIVSLVLILAGGAVVGAAAAFVALRGARSQGAHAKGTPVRDELFHVFSRLSHHLKTSREVVRGHLHAFSDELPRDEERWRVARRTVLEETDSLSRLVDRLDVVVRLGMAGQPVVFEPVSIPRMLEDLMVDLGPLADERGILFGGVLHDSAKEHQYVSADPVALREVFANLFENALRHNPPGTEVTASVTTSGGALQVQVLDNGEGLSGELLATLFEPGAKSYRPGAGSGTGLGLFLCKLLVEAHGGRITASSRNGGGLEFTVSLPLRRTTNGGL